MKNKVILASLLILAVLILGTVFNTLQRQLASIVDTEVIVGAVDSYFETTPVLNNNQDITLELKPNTASVSVIAEVGNAGGYTQIGDVTAKIYRTSQTSACTPDDNNCYEISSGNCTTSSCSGLTCTITCQANLKHYAQPTDTDSPWEGDTWRATMTLANGDVSENSNTQNLNTLLGLSVTQANITYPSLEPGQDSGSTNPETELINAGNSPLSIEVKGTNLTDTTNTIAVGEQEYNLTAFTYGAGTSLTLTETALTNLDRPDSDTPVDQDVFWGINIPEGTPAGTYTGTNTFSFSADPGGWGYYTLEIASTSGGFVTTPGEGTFTYEENQTVSLVAEADENYEFTEWTGNTATIDNPTSATTTIDMEGNYSITANFAEEGPTAECLEASVGDECGGGIVAYVNEETNYVLIAAKEDVTNSVWGTEEGATTGATGTAIGTGKDNTDLIIENDPTSDKAADRCVAYRSSVEGYEDLDDWFLPSKDELNELYKNKEVIGNFSTSSGPPADTYWSSSESSEWGAWEQRFDNGATFDYVKEAYHHVRCVREEIAD